MESMKMCFSSFLLLLHHILSHLFLYHLHLRLCNGIGFQIGKSIFVLNELLLAVIFCSLAIRIYETDKCTVMKNETNNSWTQPPVIVFCLLFRFVYKFIYLLLFSFFLSLSPLPFKLPVFFSTSTCFCPIFSAYMAIRTMR